MNYTDPNDYSGSDIERINAAIGDAQKSNGIVRIFTSLAVSSTYYLRPFLYESFIFCWPGIVITAAGVPALIVLFRHTGVMWAMRHERINRWEKRENS